MTPTIRYLAIAGRIGSGKDTLAKRLSADLDLRTVAMADELKRRTRDVLHVSPSALWGPSETRWAPLNPTTLAVAEDYWRMSSYWEALFPARAGHYEVRAEKAAEVLRLLRAGSPPGSPPTVRWALQVFGTEFGRALDPDVWVRAWRRSADHLLDGGGYSQEEGVLGGPSTAPKGVVVTDVRFPNEAQAILDAGGRVILLDAEERIGRRTDTHTSEDDTALARFASRVNANGSTTDTYRNACGVLGLL